MRARLAIAALVFAAVLAPGAAAAQPRASAVEVAGVVTSAGDDGPVFFGPAGQIYEPAQAPDTWSRRALGGVATRVKGVLRSPSGALFAAGDKTPLFRREGGVWYAHELPNRGRAALALGGGVPALGIGRHVYVLRGDSWTRRGRAPGDIAAIWAGASGRVYLATDDGKLYRKDERRVAELRHRLDDDDRIAALVGRPGDDLYALATSGAVLQVGRSGARRANYPAALAGIRIDAFGYLPDGTPAVAGRVGEEAGETAGRAALVALRDGALVLEAWLPPVPADDRVAAIGARSGAPLVATRGGRVAIRDGDTWREGRVSGALPDANEHHRDGSAPARSP